jgi:hypothetical protein
MHLLVLAPRLVILPGFLDLSNPTLGAKALGYFLKSCGAEWLVSTGSCNVALGHFGMVIAEDTLIALGVVPVSTEALLPRHPTQKHP